MAAREQDLGSVIGPQGPQGPKGDKGDMIFGFEVDAATGDLYCVYQDGSTPPNFEYESATGDLYLIVD